MAGGLLPEPPSDAHRLTYTCANDLASVRARLRRRAAAAGLAPDRAEALVIAVNELASNSIEHTTAGSGMLRVWRDGDALVCQIDDFGQFSGTLGAGMPETPGMRGYGLPLVRCLTDQVDFAGGPAGTTWRLRMSLNGPAVAPLSIPDTVPARPGR